MIASKHGYLNVARLLLNKGAQVHLRDKSGQTAFLKACMYGQKAIVELFLNWLSRRETNDSNTTSHLFSASAIDCQDSEGRSGLILASNSGHTVILDFLLESGALIDLTFIDGTKMVRFYYFFCIFCTLNVQQQCKKL